LVAFAFRATISDTTATISVITAIQHTLVAFTTLHTYIQGITKAPSQGTAVSPMGSFGWENYCSRDCAVRLGISCSLLGVLLGSSDILDILRLSLLGTSGIIDLLRLSLLAISILLWLPPLRSVSLRQSLLLLLLFLHSILFFFPYRFIFVKLFLMFRPSFIHQFSNPCKINFCKTLAFFVFGLLDFFS
jgi:hypothetical protein